jgi:hypothetical protein
MVVWWKMRQYLKDNKVPYGNMPKHKKILDTHDDFYWNDVEEYSPIPTIWTSHIERLVDQ